MDWMQAAIVTILSLSAIWIDRLIKMLRNSQWIEEVFGYERKRWEILIPAKTILCVSWAGAFLFWTLGSLLAAGALLGLFWSQVEGSSLFYAASLLQGLSIGFLGFVSRSIVADSEKWLDNAATATA